MPALSDAAAGPHTPGLLDSPPPTPQLAQAPTPKRPSLSDLAGPTPAPEAGALPLPVLRGLMDMGQQIGSSLDAIAQVKPDASADVLLVKTALQRLMARLIESGAPPTSSTAAGAGFPAGGLVPAGPQAP